MREAQNKLQKCEFPSIPWNSQDKLKWLICFEFLVLTLSYHCFFKKCPWTNRARWGKECEGTSSKSNRPETLDWRFSLWISAAKAMLVEPWEIEQKSECLEFFLWPRLRCQESREDAPNPISTPTACLRTESANPSPSDIQLTPPSHSRLKPLAWTILMLGKQSVLLAKS